MYHRVRATNDHEAAPTHPERFDGHHAAVHRRGRAEAARLVRIEHTLAELGSRGCGTCCTRSPYVNALGALTGNQAVQQVRAGLKAIYLSGWQVAADANRGADVPRPVALPRELACRGRQAHQQRAAARRPDRPLRGRGERDWFAPIMADAEAGFGGPLNAYELMKGMIEAGAAGVHFEDQLASEKKCGHLGGKVLVPTSQFIRTLTRRASRPT
jgi:isocitrate lyase